MSRYVHGLSRWIVSACLLACARAALAAPVVVTYAEQPVQLVRDTSVHTGGRNMVLQDNDLVDAGKTTIQLDAGGTTIALGPDARIFIKSGTELVLLSGWMKVRGAARGPQLSTAQLTFDSSGASVTLHAAPGATELFAESGDVALTELAAGKPVRTSRLPREQFGAKAGALPLKLAAHPPPAFLAGMPRAFLDALIPVAAKGPAVPPKRERAATFAELAPWLAAHPALRQQVQRRFYPPVPSVPVRATPVRSPSDLF